MWCDDFQQSGSGGVHSQCSPVLTGGSTEAPCSCWDYSSRNGVALLLRKEFLDHACFLSCFRDPRLDSSPPLPLLSLASSSWLLSLAPRAMPALQVVLLLHGDAHLPAAPPRPQRLPSIRLEVLERMFI